MQLMTIDAESCYEYAMNLQFTPNIDFWLFTIGIEPYLALQNICSNNPLAIIFSNAT